jgi:transcriptional regulator with XRE-family HTH domain
MIRGKQTTAVALVGAVALASGAYTLGTQSDGSANAANKANAPQPYGHGLGPRPGLRLHGAPPGFDQLADKLGVSESALRAALEDIRADHENLRDQFASELAAALGIDKAKVTAALEKARPERPDHPRLRAPRAFAAALAKQLGLSTDKVRDALEQQRGHHGDPADLARALGVSEAKLRAAFQNVMGTLRPHAPGRPFREGFANLAKELGVTQAQLEVALKKVRDAHKDDFAQALADRLNLDVGKVKDALADIGPFGFGRHHP